MTVLGHSLQIALHPLDEAHGDAVHHHHLIDFDHRQFSGVHRLTTALRENFFRHRLRR
jgi:hypothetical protein